MISYCVLNEIILKYSLFNDDDGRSATILQPRQFYYAAFSRFGVMGFKDPNVAFSNIARMLRPGGRLAFCCWRTIEENEVDYLPVVVAGLEARVRRKPYSFSKAGFIRRLLEINCFKDIKISAHDMAVSCGDLDDTIEVLLSVGALGQIVRNENSLRETVEPKLRSALKSRFNPQNVELNAAVWIVTARAT